MRKKAKRRPLYQRLKKRAETVFHKWIRERDKRKGCITCGGPVQHAGHWKHGTCDLEEWNLNGQCLKCNFFKSGDGTTYTLRMIDLYGLDKVREYAALAARGQGRKYLISELEEVIKHYS